ncbi:MAG: diguanylate cyclase [Betaproteobacteria bacterium]|nr:diguanylate cyclase [Betaproteobacteria bacterium]
MAAESGTPGTPGRAAVLAKGALRRLAQAQLEPTPENYARAFAEEAGAPPPAARPKAGAGWPVLVERLVRNLERGSRQWTTARRKESLFRVLDGSRSDEERLAQRLGSLLQAWESDRASDAGDDRLAAGAEGGAWPAGETAPAPLSMPVPPGATTRPAPLADAPTGSERTGDRPASAAAAAAEVAVTTLADTVRTGLGDADRQAAELSRRIERLIAARASLPEPLPGDQAELAAACRDSQRWFAQRHELTRQLTALCAEMSQGLVDLSEDESWSRGQCEALRAQIGDAVDLRGVRAASAMLADTRTRQTAAKREREAARAALKQVLAGMIGEVGALQQQAGGFELAIERHASAVEAADSLEGLASVVQAMLADSRQLRTAIGASHERLQRDSHRAAELETRVRDLEADLRRLSDEACTDALTQVANRRGLEQHFAAASAHAARAGEPLAVGLIDIDNFKKLNDRLGHAAGDLALKSLAAEVRQRLRGEDQVARFGGEEFVVLLPGLAAQAAQQALTRLQRALSASLFLHEGEEVFVTFSAGVTAWQAGEPLQAAIERADAGLYEAKRAGKNRTCVG